MAAQLPALVWYGVRVMHRRRVAPLYRFVYRIGFLLVDLDRLREAHRAVGVFSVNRFNLFAWHERDHGAGDNTGLRAWVERTLQAAGISLDGGRIRLLTQPRMLGWAFNPVSFYYCEHADGRLCAVIAEVNNTFGERHHYVLGPDCMVGNASTDGAIAYECELVKDKCFHVSPFFDLVGRYHFWFTRPGARLRVVLKETRQNAPLIDTTMAGNALPLTNRQLLMHLASMPIQALRVIGAIHWQALKIWLRGARFHRKPPPPSSPVT